MKSRSAIEKVLAIAVGAALGTSVAVANEQPNPYAKPDESWISISGTVLSPDADSFTLDYGPNTITVEMDDWDQMGDALGLLEGDKVTVYGAIDDDLYEIAKIEAGSVYVEGLNTFFYANSADEEGAMYFPSPYVWYTVAPIAVNQVTVRGTVTSVDKDDREFTIDSGKSQLSVDAEQLGYNPFDSLGYQKLNVGDVVSVSGVLDYEFLDGRELEASSVVTLFDAKQTNSES